MIGRSHVCMVCRLTSHMVLHMFDARDRVETVAACQHDEEEDAIGELQPVEMM